MPQEIELPDGAIAEFPDDFAPDQIESVLRGHYAPEESLGYPTIQSPVPNNPGSPFAAPVMDGTPEQDGAQELAIMGGHLSEIPLSLARGALNLPTTIANKVKGQYPGMPGYTEPAFTADERPSFTLADPFTEQEVRGFSPTVQKLAGGYNAVAEGVNQLLTPTGITTAPLLVGKIAKPALAAFLGGVTLQEPAAIESAFEIAQNPDSTPLQVGQAIGQAAIVNPAFAALLYGGLKGPAAPKPEPFLNPEVEAAAIRGGLPQRELGIQMPPEFQNALANPEIKGIVDRALQEAQTSIIRPDAAIDQLAAQRNVITPAKSPQEFRPGGGATVGGKVSFNRPAEEVATGRTVAEQPRPFFDRASESEGLGRPSTAPTIEDIRAHRAAEARENLPPVRPGDTSIKIQQPDGTVIDAVTNGKDWEVGGEKIPNVGRPVDLGNGQVLWSDGPLRPGERIISDPKEKAVRKKLYHGRASYTPETSIAERTDLGPGKYWTDEPSIAQHFTGGENKSLVESGTPKTNTPLDFTSDWMKTPEFEKLKVLIGEKFPKWDEAKWNNITKPYNVLANSAGGKVALSKLLSAAGYDSIIARGITGFGDLPIQVVELPKTITDSAISAVQAAKKKLQSGFHGGQTAMGIPTALLDTALSAVELALKAGKPLADAIEAGLKHIRHNLKKGDWNEKEVRAYFDRELGGSKPAAAGPDKLLGDDAKTGEVSGIQSPEGQKPRSFSARATVSEKIPEPVQEQIKTDPRSSYTQQRVPDVEELVKKMPDAELEALTPESPNYTLGKAERINRMKAAGSVNNTAILDMVQDISGRLTTAGQIVNQAKFLNALKPEIQVLKIDADLKKAGKDPLTPAQKDKALETGRKAQEAKEKLEEATTSWRNEPTPENAAKAEKALDAANAAALEVQRIALKFQPKSWAALLKALLQGNLLTPMSQTANLFGNTSFAPWRAGSRTVEAGFDAIESAVTGAPRTSSVGPISGTVEAVKGFARGAKEIPRILNHGTGNVVLGETRANLNPVKAWMNQFAKTPDMPTTGGKLSLNDRAKLLVEGTIGIPAEIMLRGLGAADKPFREAARGRATASELRLAKVPKDQWDFAQKFPELFFEGETLKRIQDKSDYAVFQRQSKTLNAITKMLASKGEFLDLMASTIAPYKVTPWNIISEILSYNPPVAFAKGLYSVAKKDRRAINEAAGKFVVGSVLTTGAYLLYRNGILSPSLDSKDETMKERILSGQVMPPNHINISALKRWRKGGSPQFVPGDTTVDVMRAGGLAGAMMYMTANIGRDIEKQPEGEGSDLAWKILTESTLEQARFGLNQSFLSGVEGFLSAIKEGNADDYVTKWANTVTSIPLPNTLTSLSRATRTNKPDFSGKFTDRLENVLRNKLGAFGADDELPLKRGIFGEPIPETPAGRNPLVYHMFDVSRGQQVTDDPVRIELYRLWRKHDEPRAIPTPPPDRLTWESKNYPLNPKQHEDLAVKVGEARLEIVTELVNDTNFMAMTDEEKIKILSKYYDKGLEIGKEAFWNEHGSELEAKPAKAGFKP